MNSQGSAEVVGIYITAQEGQPTFGLEQVKAVEGRGLEGDRYFDSRDPSADPGKRSEVTLIESEALLAAKSDYDISLPPGDARRNLVTRGVALNHLVGRSFRVGGALLQGVRLCEPCQYLEGLTQPGVRQALIHRGGLRAKILKSGTIKVGDAVAGEAG